MPSSSIFFVLINIFCGTHAYCQVYSIWNVEVTRTLLRKIKSIGTNMCAEECLRTSACISFDYDDEHFECNLFDTLLTTEKSSDDTSSTTEISFDNTSTTTEISFDDTSTTTDKSFDNTSTTDKNTNEYTWTNEENITDYSISVGEDAENNSNIHEENITKSVSPRCSSTLPYTCGCDGGYKCVETFSGSTCVRIYCPKHHIDEEGTVVNITNVSVGNNETYWSSIDEEQRMSIVCQTDGTWSAAVKLRRPATCADIRRNNFTLTNREFWIYPNVLHNTERVKVFCLENKEYLTLNRSNWITQHDYTNLYDDPCCDLKGPLKTCYFQKIRFDPETFEVDGKDFQYTSGTCGTQSILIGYGEGYDCSGGGQCTPYGKVNIDLTGTGMAVSPDVEWERSGPSNPVEDFYISPTREVVSFTCAGDCAHCQPLHHGVVSLSKSSEKVPFESAAAVYCY